MILAMPYFLDFIDYLFAVGFNSWRDLVASFYLEVVLVQWVNVPPCKENITEPIPFSLHLGLFLCTKQMMTGRGGFRYYTRGCLRGLMLVLE